MRIKFIVVVVAILLVSVFLNLSIFNGLGLIKRDAYVDIISVFNEFKLKKELQQKMDYAIQQNQQKIDSLKFSLKMLYTDSIISSKDRFVRIREIQNEMDQNAYQNSQQEQILSKQYDIQIWTQLNQYIKEFGKEKNLDFLYGANGQGTVLYADDKYNLTEECISYVNNKYLGIE